MILNSRQSSAKRRASEALTYSGRSFMKATNNGGPRTVPCGTPEIREVRLSKLFIGSEFLIKAS